MTINIWFAYRKIDRQRSGLVQLRELLQRRAKWQARCLQRQRNFSENYEDFMEVWISN